MKKLLNVALFLLLAGNLTAGAQDIETFVAGMLQQYPQARLLDIYKSCFQDYMGAEHLVSDTASVRAYLQQELDATSADDLLPWYWEPCGVNGNYVRVSLRSVLEGLITADELLDAFIASANTLGRPSVEDWSRQWHDMIAVIDCMGINLPQYEQDKQFIDDVLAQGRYAISHSSDYRDAYAPHYRIVRRDIFNTRFAHLLPCGEPSL